jgi:site-specific recombinase XerD
LLKEQLLARTRGTSLVFPNAKGEQWNRHRFGEQVWQPGVEAAGYESLGFHQLRHGDPAHVRPRLPARVGAERVGHADGGALILKRYRHLVAEAC